MIITRTPFRISFAGGGTDLRSFHKEETGVVLSAAIARYMYLTVKHRFGGTFRVSYSKTEICDSVDDIAHPIVKECLKTVGVAHGLEIVSIADLPSQSGLGSSSSFTVGLLNALHAHKGDLVSQAELAREACEIEVDRLKEPIGKQDQYIAAYGGLQVFQFQPDGKVFADPVICASATKRELQRRLKLFYVGGDRPARSVLAKQEANLAANRDALRMLSKLALEMRDVLVLGRDLNRFGYLLHEAWETKKTLESSISNRQIDEYYARGLRAGALGGKLLGAGGGGFLLLYCEPNHQERLRRALGQLTEVPFDFEPQGSKVIYVGEDQW